MSVLLYTVARLVFRRYLIKNAHSPFLMPALQETAIEVTEPPCPMLKGTTSRSSSSRQPDDALRRELVSSPLNGAYTDPQNIVWSHTFAEEEMTQLGARVKNRTGRPKGRSKYQKLLVLVFWRTSVGVLDPWPVSDRLPFNMSGSPVIS